MIIDIGCVTIDFSKIERVGSVYGDTLYRRYDVYFTSGNKVTIFIDRCEIGAIQMERDHFIRKWKSVMKKYYNIKKSSTKNKEKDEDENT